MFHSVSSYYSCAEDGGTTGKSSEFHPGADRVEDYKERFLLYCEANGVTSDNAADKKIAILLTSVGSVTYALLKNLVRPDRPQDNRWKSCLLSSRTTMNQRSLSLLIASDSIRGNSVKGKQ